MSMLNKSRDPVCQMLVESDLYVIIYMENKYLFCSQQCKDRFLSNPYLYIGKPGKPSPKQRGSVVIKQRVIKLDHVIPDDIQQHITDTLNQMMGIRDITIQQDTIKISYDLLEVTINQIESALEKTGNQLSSSWGDILKRAFINYFEETEIANLENGSDKHC